MDIGKAVVFGATGATGRSITAELVARGIPVRVVSRSEQNLERDFGALDVERHAADVTDAGAATRAADGCDVIIVAVGAHLPHFAVHIQVARATVAAMQATSARCLLITGYWAFAPIRALPLRESSPRNPTNVKTRLRKQQEDILHGAGAGIVHLPDFYGPGVSPTSAMLNGAMQSVLNGKTAMWPGDPEAVREFIYMPDVGPAVCDLAAHEEAYGEGWIVAGAGPITPRRAVQAAAAYAGAKANVRPVPRVMIKLAGLFNRNIRAFQDVLPIYQAPVYYDASKARALLGTLSITPYERGLAATVDWLRVRG